MFSISELVESKGYKNFMKYVYGWGASVVLIGALFKIMHFPGASLMLTLGLTIEALIFFFSAFEPLHEELDWTLVYPELSGLTDDFEEEDNATRKFDRANDMPQIGGAVVGGVVGGVIGGVAGGQAVGGTVAAGAQQIVVGGSPSALSKFDEMLEKAEIGPEIFDKLGQGLNNLTKTAESLNNLSDLGDVSKELASKMQNAATSVGKLDETYTKSGEALKESVDALSTTYVNTAQQFGQVSKGLSDSYTDFANKLTQEINSVGENGTQYSEKLAALNTNLSALNAVYELQTQNINEHVNSSKEYVTGMKELADQMGKTAQHTVKLNEGVSELEQNIASLNNIYGNMLSSLNLK